MNDANFELEWIASPPSQHVDYMELGLPIKHGIVTTTLFKKHSNHHLYTPPLTHAIRQTPSMTWSTA
jgi:hypothetical protein